MLSGRKILIGITGGIAAYKTILLVRLLVKQGAEVQVILTPSAKEFVSPLVLSTLSKNKVYQDLADGDTWSNHVMLGRWADVMLIAPLTCNTLAKMTAGICDNLLLAVYFSATCPVVAVPAMDEDMWQHPATKRNIECLQSFGNLVMEVGVGELASGLNGPGRMAEPEDIVLFLEHTFFQKKALTGKNALVTAGPTYEPLDPVRFIGNHSSGKMGVEIANSLFTMGAEVTLVLGPSAIRPMKGITTINVTTAREMYDHCLRIFPTTSIAVMAAAVADYRPATVSETKIKKSNDSYSFELVKNPDILKACGAIKTPGQTLAGFALETNNEEANALGKLQSKNADLIVLNSMQDAGAGFSGDNNKITIFDSNGSVESWALLPKKEVASRIVEYIIRRTQ